MVILQCWALAPQKTYNLKHTKKKQIEDRRDPIILVVHVVCLTCLKQFSIVGHSAGQASVQGWASVL